MRFLGAEGMIRPSIALTRVPTSPISSRTRSSASAMPPSSVISPCNASAMTTPMVAEDDCTSAVNAVATKIPTSGLETPCIRSMNGW